MSRHQCCGLCAQGRRLCPAPDACRLSERDDGLETLGAAAVVLASIVSGFVLVWWLL